MKCSILIGPYNVQLELSRTEKLGGQGALDLSATAMKKMLVKLLLWTDLGGRQIRVSYANERPPRNFCGGGYNNGGGGYGNNVCAGYGGGGRNDEEQQSEAGPSYLNGSAPDHYPNDRDNSSMQYRSYGQNIPNPKGYSYEENASQALTMDGQDLGGRQIRVSYANERPPGNFCGGGYNNGGGGYGNNGGGGYGGGGRDDVYKCKSTKGKGILKVLSRIRNYLQLVGRKVDEIVQQHEFNYGTMIPPFQTYLGLQQIFSKLKEEQQSEAEYSKPKRVLKASASPRFIIISSRPGKCEVRRGEQEVEGEEQMAASFSVTVKFEQQCTNVCLFEINTVTFFDWWRYNRQNNGFGAAENATFLDHSKIIMQSMLYGMNQKGTRGVAIVEE
ncbi:hypothetical protein C5167_019743 [Papaver somniferum]|uniref:Uncharacterized protein n=1 Tax=Papaver somniferum TaxID=3469 RepID=A0A4Y7IRJ6_PAPSO|nr:hypothetical protein C5167_019743 [Papaver somniferum]